MTRYIRRNPRRRRAPCAAVASSSPKTVWIETTNVQVLLTALESGLSTTALFTDNNLHLAEQWRAVGRFNTFILNEKTGVVSESDDEPDWNKNSAQKSIGIVCPVHDATDVIDIAKLAGVEPLVIIDCGGEEDDDENDDDEKTPGWKIIPAENLIAAFGKSQDSTFMAFADTFQDAIVMFEALHVGVDGVVLRTEDPGQVRELSRYLQNGANGGETDFLADERSESSTTSTSSNQLSLTPATVTKVRVVGVGDRVCVDCTSNFDPGEGLLVGSFARGLFLVHSECLSSFGYVNSRPFRVNAGPVCAYVLGPGGATSYLSELKTGDEVLSVDSRGNTKVKTVGRVKIEKRQMVLVEAVVVDGDCDEFDDQFEREDEVFIDEGFISSSASDDDDVCLTTEEGNKKITTYAALLQNAETVRLVHDTIGSAVSVSTIKVGDSILVHRLRGARHTGIAISEEGWDER